MSRFTESHPSFLPLNHVTVSCRRGCVDVWDGETWWEFPSVRGS